MFSARTRQTVSNLWTRSARRRARPSRRHAIAPPELLEPRNAPGACWLLPPLVDFTAADAAGADCFDAWAAEAAREATGNSSAADGSPSTLTAASNIDRLDLPRISPDWLGLLSGETTDDGMPRRSPHAARHPTNTSSLVGDGELASLNFARSAGLETQIVTPIKPAVESHRSARAEQLSNDPPPILKQTTLPPAAPVLPSGSGGGGSSGSASGGALAASGHAAVASAAPASAGVVAPAAVAPVAPPSHVAAPTNAAVQPAVSTQAIDAAIETVLDDVQTPPEPTTPAQSPTPAAVSRPIDAEPAATPAAVASAAAVLPTTSTATAAASQAAASQLVQNSQLPAIAANGPVLSAQNVSDLLDRASMATSRSDAIIAVVDRNGQILGARVEDNVPIDPADTETLVFAIDGAVAKARTAAFFSNDQAALTSRTVRFISQSTITQREVESNPNIADLDSAERGPGFVAPIGLGGHFPPGVMFTPHVDLFAIEHTNRDSQVHVGEDRVRGTADDIDLGTRFGADFAAGQDVSAPESYGFVSDLMPDAQARGIATLPGGIPIYKNDDDGDQRLVGGIGVFFPGPDGYATFEQNFEHADDRPGQKPQSTDDRLNAPLVLEAEYMAFVAINGDPAVGISPSADCFVPTGRIDLVGITLEGVGPHPFGPGTVFNAGRAQGVGTVNGVDLPVNSGGDLFIDGESVPQGWLVDPRDAADGSLTANDVRQIIEDGIAEAERVRSAIRLPLGSRSRMVFSVTDTNGEILGLFRMDDATFFSIDVAVAKARNVAYYADPAAVQDVDLVDGNLDGTPDVDAGVAFTNRTFRYLATTYFPTGVDTAPPGPFSILNDPGINPTTGENLGAPLPADEYNSVLGFDAFNPGTNFREADDPNAVIGNQNGIVFFPGSSPLYKNGVLVGGLGISGDGVDQDDVVTFSAAGDLLPGRDSGVVRADQTFVRGVRLPYQKFLRNPRG